VFQPESSLGRNRKYPLFQWDTYIFLERTEDKVVLNFFCTVRPKPLFATNHLANLNGDSKERPDLSTARRNKETTEGTNMTPISIQADQTGFHGKARALKTISRAVALATVLVASAGLAQAADSNDRVIPPNPADVAMLRNLLALQHPALRQTASSASASTGTAPTVVTEPTQQSGQTS
jgi:hypothetical protein